MKQGNKQVSNEGLSGVGMAIMTIVWMFSVMVMASGCSFRVEAGYHGQTGRDDRIQTQLVRGGGQVRSAKDEERY